MTIRLIATGAIVGVIAIAAIVATIAVASGAGRGAGLDLGVLLASDLLVGGSSIAAILLAGVAARPSSTT